ncbi:hypothetical protein CROQUDRAFT_111265 [Cronartium quercuum f. sp. fusiforme G11]|uniref:Uncharacterized protein n=1 Tax=Cronartium quercuum f. sp. fusiforme G11 TaxID=708437 RepID=A0A9P6T5Q8_9BASI|nr:hypothetical protein CROQUDRAFT_111265 [Cronartium quercuum f. sp. fusiforme G11]
MSTTKTEQRQSETSTEIQSDTINNHALIEHLSTQLISTGHLRNKLPINTFSSSIDGQESLTKAIFSLINSHHEWIKRREIELSEKRESEYEFNRLIRILEDLKRDKLKAEQISFNFESKFSATNKMLEEEKNSHKRTKEEYTKLLNSEKLIRVSCGQEIKRRTIELEELQKRLSKLIDSGTINSGREKVNQVIAKNQSVNITKGLMELELEGVHEIKRKLGNENEELRRLIKFYEKSLLDIIKEIDSNCHFEFESEPRLRALVNELQLPTSELFKRLSSVTYELREKVIGLKDTVTQAVANIEGLKSKAVEDTAAVEKAVEIQLAEKEQEIESLRLALAEAEKVVDGWARTGFGSQNPKVGWIADVSMADDSVLPPTQTTQAPEAGPSMTVTQLKQRELERVEVQRKREMAEYEERQRKILEELNSPDHPPQRSSTHDTTLESLVVFTKAPEQSERMQTKESLKMNKKQTTTITSAKGEGSSKKVKSSISNRPTRANLKAPIVTRTSLRRKLPIKNVTNTLNSVLAVTGDSNKPIPTSSTTTNNSRTVIKPEINPRNQTRVTLNGRDSKTSNKMKKSTTTPEGLSERSYLKRRK